MAYTALNTMNIYVPEKQSTQRTYGRECLSFIRDCCENLKFYTSEDENENQKFADCQDKEGKDGVPYNVERDVDRLCLENAAARFLKTGSREDAFDIYYCYCEIFKPFGEGYQATRVLLEMLSEHEMNSSSLLMKHRDHYSHSVYVFLLGLAIYKNDVRIRKVYNIKYGFEEEMNAAASRHFLEHWGLASLFHDIGYPFEISHQQMKAYVCQLEGVNKNHIGDVGECAPYVSYRHMDAFANVNGKDLNHIYAKEITERIGGKYGVEVNTLYQLLADRGVHDMPVKEGERQEYLFMDHAYFSGLILLKKYLECNPDIEMVPQAVMDAFVAVILHNSLFKFGIRGKQEGLALEDDQPLSFLLMLCDELQCWDRTSYGQNSRADIYPFDFDMEFYEDGMTWTYYYDSVYAQKTVGSKMYQAMSKGYTKKNGTKKDGYKFADDIDEIVGMKEKWEITMNAVILPKNRKSHKYMSDSNYLNLYDFALALNGRYDESIQLDLEQMEKKDIYDEELKERLQQSFDQLTLELKLSNIAQAKGFAKILDRIGCFYTDQPVDNEVVRTFTEEELMKISELEHKRWLGEKAEMGWSYGMDYLKCEDKKRMRAITRKHKDMIDFHELKREDIVKDMEPMRWMLRLLKVFDGLSVYRM